jgi:branched-chain amino acid transport system permease protein
MRFGLPFPLCFFIGLFAALFWAWITGYLCVRLAGIYFAIMTVVVTQSTFYIIFQWYGFTGGDDGIQGIFPPWFLSNPRFYYYYTGVIVAAAFFLYYKIISSPFGLSLKCIRENMVRSQFVGVNVHRHRLLAFVIAGFFAGLSGILFAPFTRTVVPQMGNWTSSGHAVFMGILGGAAHLLGPMVGAVVWVFLDAFVAGFTEHWPLIIGLIIFTIVLFMPGGLVGLATSYLRAAKDKRSNQKWVTPESEGFK